MEMFHCSQMNGSTHASKVTRSWGGVARNMAECLHRLGASPVLLTALGEDAYSKNGSAFDFECRSPVPKTGSTTSSYTAVLDRGGECLIGFGDMDLHDTITPEWVSINFFSSLSSPDYKFSSELYFNMEYHS